MLTNVTRKWQTERKELQTVYKQKLHTHTRVHLLACTHIARLTHTRMHMHMRDMRVYVRDVMKIIQ